MGKCRCGEVKPRDQSSCGRPDCLIAVAAIGERWEAERDKRTWRHTALRTFVRHDRKVRVDRFAETQMRVHATRVIIRRQLHHKANAAAYERMLRES